MDKKNKNPNVPNLRFNKESIWQTSIFNDIVERRTEKYNPSKNNQNLI